MTALNNNSSKPQSFSSVGGGVPLKDVFIVAARRTPLGAFQGALSSLSSPQLGAIALKAAMASMGVEATKTAIDQVIMGCVLPAGLGQAPARQVALGAGLPVSTPATTVNKVCGSGMKALMLGAQALMTGESKCVAVGGMENMSQVPHYLMGSRQGLRMGHGQLTDGMIKDGLWDVYNDFHMGQAAEMCASQFNFTREAQDQYAIESFRRAQEAQKQGWFRPEIAPVSIPQKKGEALIVDTDESPGKAQFDKMTKLAPVFKKDGTVTAANASSINDGAAALIVAQGDFVAEKKIRPLARVVAMAQHAHEPEWFTTAPVGATKKVIEAAGWSLNDVDLFEFNEAFAVVAMAAMKELEVPHSKVNVWGSGISLGHPIGASGARIIVTLVHALAQRGLKRGVAALCIGGGEATAVAVELVRN